MRGLAALAVVLFHYTTRFDALFGHPVAPVLSVPWGHYGVNLFFIISGFVIFMTIHRVRRPLDFIVSRFSRLYPVYWAAIALTLRLCSLLDLPEAYRATPGTALLNGLMFHGLFGVKHVSGVYWTLEVELLFYALMFALLLIRQLQHAHPILLGLFALDLIYVAAERYAGIHLPWRIYHLLSLHYLPWFSLGICMYGFLHATPGRRDKVLLLAALLVISLTEPPLNLFLAIGLTTLIWAASNNRLAMLEWRLPVWLGTISYPLYLLHESIGWAMLLQLRETSLNVNLSIVLTLLTVIGLAATCTYLIEQPALRWIRSCYQARN